MRSKNFFDREPVPIEIKHVGTSYTLVFFRENIKEVDPQGEEKFSADEYMLKLSFDPKIENRILNNQSAWLEKAKQKSFESAAKEIREKRNNLLSESDKEMCLDRIGLEMPTGSTFEDWLLFLQKISSLMFGEMARYRQELRDITKQEGFPYDVKFPEKPKTK